MAFTPIDRVVISMRTLNPGQHTFSSAPIPVGATLLTLSIDRTQWTDPSTQIDFGIEVSQDNGVTWASWGRATASGGAGLERDGVTPVTESNFSVTLLNPQNSQRQVRGDVIIVGSPTVAVNLRLA